MISVQKSVFEMLKKTSMKSPVNLLVKNAKSLQNNIDSEALALHTNDVRLVRDQHYRRTLKEERKKLQNPQLKSQQASKIIYPHFDRKRDLYKQEIVICYTWSRLLLETELTRKAWQFHSWDSLLLLYFYTYSFLPVFSRLNFFCNVVVVVLYGVSYVGRGLT